MIRTRAAAASVLGVHPDTLKRWEDEGIIPDAERDSANRRMYSEADIVRLRQIAEERRAAYLNRFKAC